MNKENSLYMIIQSAVFLIPVATLVWKAARQSAQIESNKSKIIELEKKIANFDKTVDVQLAQIQAGLNEIKISIVKLETRLDYEKPKEAQK